MFRPTFDHAKNKKIVNYEYFGGSDATNVSLNYKPAGISFYISGCKDNNNRGPNLLDLVLIPGSTSKKRSACWHIDVDQGVWDQASRDYAGAFCSNWYGWSDGDTNGAIWTMFYSRTRNEKSDLVYVWG